jgi:hypothetical protein
MEMQMGYLIPPIFSRKSIKNLAGNFIMDLIKAMPFENGFRFISVK